MLNATMIGNKISEGRKQLNISQAQLADHLFISAQAVGKWERGESLPDILTLNKLAELFGVDLNYFSDQEKTSNEMQSPDPLREIKENPKQKPKWNFSRGNWVDADFSGLKNLNEKFSGSNMQRCQFKHSDLSGLLLAGNNINSCDFTASNLSASQIKASNLEANNFSNCNITEANLTASHFSKCDFSQADLSGAHFHAGGFEKNTLTGATFNRTVFSGMYLADVSFDGTIEDCSFENCAFKRVRFQNATLINTFFKNRSLKQLRFIDCKADRLTYEFLKNGKADLSGLSLMGE